MSLVPPAVLSPCIGLCKMRGDGVCGGCLRTLDEIAAWPQMDDDARKTLMEHLPGRAHA